MLSAAPSNRRPTWKVATVVRPTVKLSGSTWVSCWLSTFVYGSREISGNELAIRGDAVEQVGVDHVDPGSADHPVPSAVVLRSDAVVSGSGIEEVTAGPAVQEVGAAAAREPVASRATEHRV